MSGEFRKAAKVGDVSAESSVAVEVAGVPILICHSKGRYFAVINRCSHANEKLECGRVRNGWIACPVHGARFDLLTGRAMNPPATQPIETYPLRLEGDWIEVEI
jgi:3-phenylpropionate/trans-cinnamate dioxygenase ferredoxin component